MISSQLRSFIEGIPKAELHLHIEGSFEPELMFEIANRNDIDIPFDSVEEVKAAYSFHNLQSFLDIYYQGASVLIHEQDFYDLTWAYLEKVNKQQVRHIEIFFDPQTHTDRGIDFAVCFNGIYRALEDGQIEFGITFKLIMCFLRHLSEDAAFQTLKMALPYKDKIFGVGLDSSEIGHPPSKFERVFKAAADEGFVLMAHAGEEGPAPYIWEAITQLNVERIDHGNRCLDDPDLVRIIAQRGIPLTLCPLSNVELKVVDNLDGYPIRKMSDAGLLITLNSDDPAYFGGYMNENFIAVTEAISLSKGEIVELAKNGFRASFLSEDEKERHINAVDEYVSNFVG